MAYHFEITNGPSKLDLMLALFDGDASHRRMITFEVKDPAPSPEQPGLPDIDFVIDNIEREDGSGESWNFKGYYPGSRMWGPAVGYFNSRTRQGWVEF